MALNYHIDTNQLASDLLPIDERTTENKAFMIGLLSAFQRSYNDFLYYMQGDSAAVHWGAAVWNQYDRVIYTDGAVYEAIVTTSTEPTTSIDWIKVNDSFIGADTLQNINGSQLSLTYALNLRFGTAFNNPPALSEIFIVNEPQGLDMFQIGFNDSESSQIGVNDIESSQLTYDDTVHSSYHFTIKIPASVFTTFTPGDATDKAIRLFADKYVIAGIKYIIEDY